MGGLGLPPLTGKVELDESDAIDAVDNIEEGMDRMARSTEQSVVAASSSLEKYIILLGTAATAVKALADEEQRRHDITNQAATDAQQNLEIGFAFGLEDAEADSVRRYLQSRGLDGGDLRGLADPIQEYIAEAARHPDDPVIQQRLANLGTIFDLEAIGRGGSEGLEALLYGLATATDAESAVLPAYGVGINDVQRLRPAAADFLDRGGVAGLTAYFGHTAIQDTETIFDESVVVARIQAERERQERVVAGLEDPRSIGENLYRYPGGSYLQSAVGGAESIIRTLGVPQGVLEYEVDVGDAIGNAGGALADAGRSVWGWLFTGMRDAQEQGAGEDADFGREGNGVRP